MRPLILGYQSVRMDSPPDAVVEGLRVLTAFAEREAYRLGRVFVEADLNRPMTAFAALIHEVRESKVSVVAVPSLLDLGRLPRVQRIMRDRLERETGALVRVAELADPDRESLRGLTSLVAAMSAGGGR